MGGGVILKRLFSMAVKGRIIKIVLGQGKNVTVFWWFFCTKHETVKTSEFVIGRI